MDDSREGVRRDQALLLCGMMGSGKSSVGRALAERLDRAFIDTDAQIEGEAGESIPELFARCESEFRALERRVLVALPARDAVVALGGGSVTTPENLSIIRSKGVLVLLRAEADTLAGRLAASSAVDERPLLGGARGPRLVERLRDLLAERATAYAEADVSVTTDRCSVEQVRDAVLQALGWEDAA